MKRILMFLAMLWAANALAVDFLLVQDGQNAWVQDDDPFAYDSRVARLDGLVGTVEPATGRTYYEFNGVRYYNVEADEALAAALPQTSATGYATMLTNGTWVKHVPVGDDIVPIPISASPLDPATAIRMEAEGIAAYNVKLAAQAEAQASVAAAVESVGAISEKEAIAKAEAAAAAAGGQEPKLEEKVAIMWKYFTAGGK